MANRLRQQLLPLVLLLATVPACARNPVPVQPPTRNDGPRVDVVNNNRASMNVYLIQGGMRVRLGVVAGHSHESFSAPARLMDDASDIQLLAHPLGSSENYLSIPVLLRPGLVIELRLEDTLSMSSLHVQ